MAERVPITPREPGGLQGAVTRSVGVADRLRPQRRGPVDIDGVIEEVRRHYPDADDDLLRRAHAYAAQAHEGQRRATGGPYIEHPVAVALLMAQLGMDLPSVAASLLHDVPEDTPKTNDDIRRAFGDETARLV
ncbi:MAG: HD domain-containing protein, partial [Chloroflexota bacterium]